MRRPEASFCRSERPIEPNWNYRPRAFLPRCSSLWNLALAGEGTVHKGTRNILPVQWLKCIVNFTGGHDE
jgi:hypothetical protein